MRRRMSFEEKMLRDLLKRKRAYEAYFKGVEGKGRPLAPDPKPDASGRDEEDSAKDAKGKAREAVKPPDNPAHSAYVSIIKALVEIAKKVPSQGRSPEEMKRIAEEILEQDYGIRHG